MQPSADRELAATPAAERAGLSLTMAVDLVVCGVFLAGLCTLAQYLQADFPRGTLFAGWANGGLCVMSGMLGRSRPRWREAAKVTLTAIPFVLFYQTVQSWKTSVDGETPHQMVPALMAVLVVFCVTMLSKLLREGKARGRE